MPGYQRHQDSKGWVGSLSLEPLAEVLKQIASEERTGDLQVIFEETSKTVYFDRGFVVFAASNLETDRLGHRLIRAGHITRDDFLHAAKLMKRDKKRLGQALVQAGVMSEENIGHQVAMQVNGIVHSLFGLSGGVYSFDERACSIPLELMVSLSIHRILLEGIRVMSHPDLIGDCLPSPDTLLCIAERPPFTWSTDKLTSGEQAVLRAMGDGARLDSLLDALPEDRQRALRACYGLFSSGILETHDREATAAPLKVQEETRTFRLSELERSLGETQATSMREEIKATHESLEQSSDAELLRVEAHADEKQIDETYAERRQEWSWVRTLVLKEPELLGKLTEIEERLESAYRRVLERRQRPDLEPPSSDAGPVTRPEPGRSPAEPPPEASRKDRRSPATARPGPKDVIGAKIREREEQILVQVDEHRQARDWEGGIALLFELVELAPRNATYRRMLATTMAKHPLQRRRAERHFLEALRLSPQDPELHVALGIYYKSFGLKSRAETEFLTAIRIDPDHQEARFQLTGERSPRSAWGTLFGRMLPAPSR